MLEGKCFVAFGFDHETQLVTRGGICSIRIRSSNYSTLNQHLQDVRTIGAHEKVRDRIRPKLGGIRYSDTPIVPHHSLLDMFPTVAPPNTPPRIEPPAPTAALALPAPIHECVPPCTDEHDAPPTPYLHHNDIEQSTSISTYIDLLVRVFETLHPGSPSTRTYTSTQTMLPACTLYTPNTRTPLITATHNINSRFPIFLFHACNAKEAYDPARIYKGV
jgi:hypothetical protein